MFVSASRNIIQFVNKLYVYDGPQSIYGFSFFEACNSKNMYIGCG